jgi:hypothetical protein
MLTAVLLAATLLGQQADPEVLPPPPTESEMLAELRSERPTARVVDSVTRTLPNGSLRICGTMDLAGQIEPFMLQAEEGNRTSAIVTLAGQEPPASRPEPKPRYWKIGLIAPGGWDFVEDSRTDPRIQGLYAYNRKSALEFCPSLRPPEGVVWRTEVQHP